jgi:hypothetical protein
MDRRKFASGRRRDVRLSKRAARGGGRGEARTGGRDGRRRRQRRARHVQRRVVLCLDWQSQGLGRVRSVRRGSRTDDRGCAGCSLEGAPSEA